METVTVIQCTDPKEILDFCTALISVACKKGTLIKVGGSSFLRGRIQQTAIEIKDSKENVLTYLKQAFGPHKWCRSSNVKMIFKDDRPFPMIFAEQAAETIGHEKEMREIIEMEEEKRLCFLRVQLEWTYHGLPGRCTCDLRLGYEWMGEKRAGCTPFPDWRIVQKQFWEDNERRKRRRLQLLLGQRKV